MSRSIRIRTKPNSDEKYVKIKLEQDFDLLEILSLKITQEDAYQSFCANYGVVAGRVSINDGFGIPNVKVSIFVPISEDDKENELIRELYPYETTADKNRNGLRYNLLPKKKQHTDHTPVGSFPEKREVLDDETFIEVYEKYYKYTTKTNEAGDFMLFGVPTGQQQLFYDLDVSDIGFLSARPYELIAQGFPESRFQDKFTFLESNDLNNLTQVRSETIPVFVKPFWCDTLNLGQEIGITRQDVPIRDYELKPTAIFMGSLFSDDEKDSLNKNCRPRKKMGQMNELITGEGNIEIIRRTQQGDIEFYRDLGDDLIDENGNWSFQVPMNLRKVVTSEDGSLIPSPNGIKGVATESDVRFRISMNKSGDDKRLRTRAKMLVPNMQDNYEFDSYSREELRCAENNGNPIFKINSDNSLTPSSLANDPANEYNYLENFFTFRWKKIYTVRQYIGRYQANENDENRNFIGIKDISDGFGVNKMPFNRIDTNVNPLYSLLCFLLTIVGLIIGIVNSLINIINSLITMLCQIKIPCGISIDIFSLKGGQYKFKYRGQSMTNPSNGNEWGDEVELEMYTTVCYDAKNVCDEVSQVGSCSEDLRDCYDAAGYSGLLKPINQIADCVGFSGADSPTGYRANLTQAADLDPTFNWGNAAAAGRCCQFHQGGWCYNFGSCIPTSPPATYSSACRRVAHHLAPISNYEAGTSNDCKKCDLAPNCPEGYFKFAGSCFGIKIKYNCIISSLLCQNCGASDPNLPNHSCDKGCKTYGGGGGDDDPNEETSECGDNGCCKDCCQKIPLITLSCPAKEDGSKGDDYTPVVLPTPFAYKVCNKNIVKPCPGCGGVQPSQIKEWVRCRLEGIAAVLGVIKFDFYNDWVNGSLYFPLIKRKYDVKRVNRKFGQIKKDKFCDFNCFDGAENKYLLDPTNDTIGGNNKRLHDIDHGKPRYEENQNIGGHAHHQNRCNSNRLVERKEFNKLSNDCNSVTIVESESGDGIIITQPEIPAECDDPFGTEVNDCKIGCQGGVAGCSAFCDCSDYRAYNDNVIKHGIIKWHKNEIYYASIIPKNGKSYHNGEYIKGNLFYPTNITELGSSTFCDIDDQPFIIDKLEPTSYRLSEQENGLSTINVSTYADIGCSSTNCVSTKNVVLSSQIGIDIYDFKDNGDDINSNICTAYFDHNQDSREYFCRRFTTYINNDLDINHKPPYSSSKDNIYDPYPEISVPGTSANSDNFNDNNGVNDGDFFLAGDKCRMYGTNKHFYALNSGIASFNLKKYPSETTTINDSGDGVSFNTSHTPYYFYFGLVPGKTALHKTVAKFFADKIDKETLQGIDDTQVNNPTQPNDPSLSADC